MRTGSQSAIDRDCHTSCTGKTGSRDGIAWTSLPNQLVVGGPDVTRRGCEATRGLTISLKRDVPGKTIKASCACGAPTCNVGATRPWE